MLKMGMDIWFVDVGFGRCSRYWDYAFISMNGPDILYVYYKFVQIPGMVYHARDFESW